MVQITPICRALAFTGHAGYSHASAPEGLKRRQKFSYSYAFGTEPKHACPAAIFFAVGKYHKGRGRCGAHGAGGASTFWRQADGFLRHWQQDRCHWTGKPNCRVEQRRNKLEDRKPLLRKLPEVRTMRWHNVGIPENPSGLAGCPPFDRVGECEFEVTWPSSAVGDRKAASENLTTSCEHGRNLKRLGW